MDLTVVDNADLSRFEARTEDDRTAGWVEYTRSPDSIVLDHTEVDDAFHGQGGGSTLVRGTLDTVIAEGVRVVNDCPFIERFLRRHEGEYESVVRVTGP